MSEETTNPAPDAAPDGTLLTDGVQAQADAPAGDRATAQAEDKPDEQGQAADSEAIDKPGEDADPSKAVPEGPDGYQIEFAEGTQVDDGLLAGFITVAHELGINREQAQKLLLLCAHLEDNILAARGLAQKIDAGEAVLQELLRGSDEQGGLEGLALQNKLPADDDLFEQCLARWVEIAQAWRLFLPAGAVFYTATPDALPGLDLNAGQPLSPDEAAGLFPVSAAAGWTFVVLSPEGFRGEVRLVSGAAPKQP